MSIDSGLNRRRFMQTAAGLALMGSVSPSFAQGAPKRGGVLRVAFPANPSILDPHIGFTGNDAESHYTQNGSLVVTISVATKESWKDADGTGRAEQTGIVLFRLVSRPSSRVR